VWFAAESIDYDIELESDHLNEAHQDGVGRSVST